MWKGGAYTNRRSKQYPVKMVGRTAKWMTVFDKFRNCITEPRCRDCDGIPGVCEYDHQSVTIPKVLALDVLNKLKEQEAVKPERQHSGGGTTWWNVCGNCRTAINPNDKYCHECGRPVKWNENL